MTTLRLKISDEKARALEDVAQRLGVSVEELLHGTIDETLERMDTDFEGAARRVLAKNAELYLRLA